MNDVRVLRDRQRVQQQLADTAIGRGKDCAAALFLQTTTVKTYPTSAGAFFACNPCQVNGNEVEGGAATPVPDTSTPVYALNVGTAVPPNGAPVIAHAVGGRWVFRYDG